MNTDKWSQWTVWACLLWGMGTLPMVVIWALVASVMWVLRHLAIVWMP